MNAKNTWLLVAVAALLFGFILAYDKFVAGPQRAPKLVLPGFKPGTITAVQVRSAKQPEIMVRRTNDNWELTRPLDYPARAEAVAGLLTTLARLSPDSTLTPRELLDHPNAETEFGFDDPLATLILTSGAERRQVLVGARTSPGDQVFVEVVGVPGIHLVSTNLLAALPQKPDDWRDTALLDWPALHFDHVLVNNGSRTLELARNATNQLWRLVRLQSRANSALIDSMLTNLETLRAKEFVTDDPRADLDAYGLQPPDLEITLTQGTNPVAALQFGRSPTNNTKLIYARRSGHDNVLAVPKEALAQWRMGPDDFRDRHLVDFTALPDAIEFQGVDQFTLVRQTNQNWRVEPQGFVADTNYLSLILTTLARAEVVQFVKDVVAEPDLPSYGLAPPRVACTLVTGRGTNATRLGLLFGTNEADRVYCKRTDEKSVYAIRRADFEILPRASWELRPRRIWHFTESDVARVRIEEGGRTRELVRNGTNTWSLGTNSFGSINTFAVEETVHRVGDLNAAFWTARGDFNRAAYGFTNPVHRLTFEMKDGSQHTLEFGGTAPSQFPYATTTIDGQPWVFEFPWDTYQYIQTYLSIPVREL